MRSRTREVVWLIACIVVVAVGALAGRGAADIEEEAALQDAPSVGGIRLGMSPVDVRRALGPPTRVEDVRPQGIDGHAWSFGPNSKLTVLFSNGRVEAVVGDKSYPRYKGHELKDERLVAAAGLRTDPDARGHIRRYFGPGFMVYAAWELEGTLLCRRRLAAIDVIIDREK